MGIVLNLADFRLANPRATATVVRRRQFRFRGAAPHPRFDLETLVRSAGAEAGPDEARCSLVLERLIAEALAL